MTNRFEGRVAVVFGGGAGIGEASAMRLASEGAAVAVADIRVDCAEGVRDRILDNGGKSIAIGCDTRVRDDVRNVAEISLTTFGQLDVAHQNVGVGYMGLLESMTDEQVKAQLDVNVVSTVNAVAVCGPMLRERGGGAIVVTSSVVAEWGSSFQVLYSAGKGAVDAIIRAAAMEYAPTVRINGVAPGLVEKSESERALSLGPERAAAIEREMADAIADFPIPRAARPADVAAAVAFFASDDAAYITGEVLAVCGGWTRGQSVRPEQLGL